jgi:hypothetical protein
MNTLSQTPRAPEQHRVFKPGCCPGYSPDLLRKEDGKLLTNPAAEWDTKSICE